MDHVQAKFQDCLRKKNPKKIKGIIAIKGIIFCKNSKTGVPPGTIDLWSFKKTWEITESEVSLKREIEWKLSWL